MKKNPSGALVSALPMPDRDHPQGLADEPIQLVEYGDYECSYCGEAYPVVKAIQEHLGERLCFAFRNFPSVIRIRTRNTQRRPLRPQPRKGDFGRCTTFFMRIRARWKMRIWPGMRRPCVWMRGGS